MTHKHTHTYIYIFKSQKISQQVGNLTTIKVRQVKLLRWRLLLLLLHNETQEQKKSEKRKEKIVKRKERSIYSFSRPHIAANISFLHPLKNDIDNEENEI